MSRLSRLPGGPYFSSIFTYIRVTFTSLSSLEETKTIVGTVTKTTFPNNAVETYIGPTVIGLRVIFWDPPGDAPYCVWTFCIQTRSLSDSKTGGGGGKGQFECLDCTAGGRDNGKRGESNQEKDGTNTCTVGKKRKRSFSARFLASFSLRSLSAEEIVESMNPLKEALANFGADKNGNSFAGAAMDTANHILLNKFPKDKANTYVTGLESIYTLTKKIYIGTGRNQKFFDSGTRLYWKVRWDYDEGKGPHVNAQFGKNPSSKFTYKLDPKKWPKVDSDGTEEDIERARKRARRMAMVKIMSNLNAKVKNNGKINQSKPKKTWKTSEKDAVRDLKEYFKQVAKEPH
ncbi:MAG: hypothetical protein M1829_000679 [Trizodia sp. TS-e1964]|nr:MAG: hypothetical protein M1829_000679 [Trizodia sp. TS-e1964]